MIKSSPVVHFEMPYADAKRCAAFYEKAFGWQMNLMGAEMGNYMLATTTETGEDKRPKEPGAINGGFAHVADGMVPCLVLGVENLEAAIAGVKQAGGEILPSPVGDGAIIDIPGIGRSAYVLDSEGTRVGLFQGSMPE